LISSIINHFSKKSRRLKGFLGLAGIEDQGQRIKAGRWEGERLGR
jgi:hypothetical protein